MGMEFKKPLIIGDIDASVKSDISQIKHDISDIETDIGSLDNLTTTDKSSLVGAINEVNTLLPPTSQRDYIDNSKAMPTGAVSTNDLILPEIKAYAHSTFDLSKFGTRGTYIIPNNGIIQGIAGGSDYAYIGVTTKDNADYEASVDIEPISSTGSFGSLFGGRGYGAGMFFEITGSGTSYVAYYRDSENTAHVIPNTGGGSNTITLQTGIRYTIKVNYNKTTKYIKINIKGGSLDETREVTADSLSSSSNALQFVYGADNVISDLKTFKLKENGIVIKSGNKTGVDTIKPDDYTVVGAPTISADGVVSGFSSGNYLICTQSLDLTKPFNIEGIFTTSNNISDAQIVLGYDSNFQLFVNGGKFNAIYNFTTCNIAIESNTTYKVFYSYDGSTNSVLKIKKLLDADYATTSATVTASSITNEIVHIGAWWNGTGQIFTGSIDLNAFKIYVDGNLVYQPCLKIPYTESKTGSKIVNEIYRDRVADMSAQFGYANYYTLQDEAKGNYTVVGSPIISSDFIASGFSASNYIKKNISISPVSSLVIKGRFTNKQNNTGNGRAQCLFEFCNEDRTERFNFGVDDSGKGFISYIGTTEAFHIYNTLSNLNQENTFEIVIDKTNYKVYVNNTLVKTVTMDVTSMSFGDRVALGVNLGGGLWVNYGSIDLKEFKIYVDNKLAYEAVIEPNFTLPQVELYGLIGQRTLRDSYRNGINYWELYSNRDLEQGGSCTSGVEVTFARPFADTNYVLSVPYSAKSATAFTPTQTGDWIAKGKGLL